MTNHPNRSRSAFRLVFQGPTGRLCRGVTESVILKVEDATVRRTKFRCDDQDAAKLVVVSNDAGNNTNECTYVFVCWDRESFFEYLQETLGGKNYEFVADVLARFDKMMSNEGFYGPTVKDFDAAIAAALKESKPND